MSSGTRSMHPSPWPSSTWPAGSTGCSRSASSIISASCSPPWSASFWCSRYGHDLQPRGPGLPDDAGAGARAAAHGLRAQGQGVAAAPAGPAAHSALSGSRAPDAQGGGARQQCVMAVSRHSLSDFRGNLGGGGVGADLRHRPDVLLVGRPHRHHRAARACALLPALAGLDVGTSFGGVGSSREVMIASLAEPAMLMIVFTLALIAGSTQLSTMAGFLASGEAGLRVWLGMAAIALIMVAIAENSRIPVDNPATHLELTMVHEAMVLEYSGRHLALIDLSSELKLLLYVSLIACLFMPWGIAAPHAGLAALFVGVAAYVAKLAVSGFLLAVFETSIAKMRVFRVPEFLGAALMLGLLATLLMFVSRSL